MISILLFGSEDNDACVRGEAIMKPCFLFNLFVLFSTPFICLSGCASSIVSFTDKTTDAQIVRMSGNRLAGGIAGVELNAQRFEKGNEHSYSLIVIYTGPAFINIKAGKTLVLSIDGIRHEFQGSGSGQNQHIISIGLIEEKAYYHDLTPDIFRMLAYAREVEVEILGSGKIVNRHFKEKNFLNFREFYDHYILTQ